MEAYRFVQLSSETTHTPNLFSAQFHGTIPLRATDPLVTFQEHSSEYGNLLGLKAYYGIARESLVTFKPEVPGRIYYLVGTARFCVTLPSGSGWRSCLWGG